MNTKPPFSLAAWVAAALLAGCASGVKLNEPPVETRTPTPVVPAGQGGSGGAAASTGTAAATTPAPQSQVASVDLTRGATGTANAEVGRVIYFDFDSFVIRDEFKPLVEGHAKTLVANPQRRMVVEGHADERGSREYNLALGQKRAEAVVRSLSLLGVNPSQVEAVSFGEERPAVQGSGEDVWAKNRRAELKDR
jgi:peptidoglycan-associated lipoprotein